MRGRNARWQLKFWVWTLLCNLRVSWTEARLPQRSVDSMTSDVHTVRLDPSNTDCTRVAEMMYHKSEVAKDLT